MRIPTRTRRRHRLSRTLPTLGAAAGALILTAGGCGSGVDTGETRQASASSTTAAASTSTTSTTQTTITAPPPRVGAEVLAEVAVGIRPHDAILADGLLWVGNVLSVDNTRGFGASDNGWGSVTVIDTATDTAVGSVPLDVTDPSRPVRGAAPLSLVENPAGGVLVMNRTWDGDGYVHHLNATPSITEQVPLDGLGPTAAATDPDGEIIWMCDYDPANRKPRLARVNADTGETIVAAPLRTAGVDIAVTDDVVWVHSTLENGDGVLNRYDIDLGAVTDSLQFDDLGGIAVADNGDVWVSAESLLQRVDAATLDTTETTDIGAGTRVIGPVAVTDDAVWVTDLSAGTVHRIDPDAGAVTDVVTVQGRPVELVADGADVWVLSELREERLANSTIPGVVSRVGVR